MVRFASAFLSGVGSGARVWSFAHNRAPEGDHHTPTLVEAFFFTELLV